MYCVKHNSPRLGPSINLHNVIPNERFNYSIVLIRGAITNYNYRHGLSIVQVSNETNENIDVAHAEIRDDGKFCVAVDLAPGINLLKFHYCCVSIDIPVVFNARENPKYLLKVFYIICENHDGRYQAPGSMDNSIEIACKKINLVIRLVQCLYAEMLAKHGYERKCFEFIECQPFYSRLTVDESRQWHQNQLWTYHAKEMLAHESDKNNQYKYFGILASTRCENRVIKGNAALGIGDVALFGSGTLYAWPLTFAAIETCFRDETAVDPNQLMDDSNGRHTFGGCFATALGSMCHEIGHIFDLGHSNDGIMGNDIDYVYRMFIVEKHPRNLPRRLVSKCSLDSKTYDDDRAATTGQRLTAVRKTNSMLTKYHSRRNDDLTFLTENGAILLNWHKWFNQFESGVGAISYDNEQRTIVSSTELALVELRSPDNGMCMHFYRFDKSNVYSFTISSDVINRNYDLIALDKNGNIKRFAANEL